MSIYLPGPDPLAQILSDLDQMLDGGLTAAGMIPAFLRRNNPIIPVIHFDGVIGHGGRFSGGINLHDWDVILQAAFSVKKAPAIAFVINSPGGSPVQSALLFKRIRALAEEKKKQVFVFAEDVMASGGYFIAMAGDEVYADESSIVGSIGVISSGFGFTGLLEKIGVDRRVYTAGESKSSLDPFQPEDPEDIEKLKVMQADVHEHFKEVVKSRRGDKLQADDAALFNGDVWAGGKAKELGLIDGLGNLHDVLREKYGKDVRIRPIEPRRGFLQGRLGLLGGGLSGGKAKGADRLAGALADGLIQALERKSLWARFDR